MGLAVYSLKLKLPKHALCDRFQRTFIENTKPFRKRLTRALKSLRESVCSAAIFNIEAAQSASKQANLRVW